MLIMLLLLILLCSLYNNVVQPSRLIQGTDFHCFKEGISPQWEDPKCSNGGKWTIVCNRGKLIDSYWLDTVFDALNLFIDREKKEE